MIAISELPKVSMIKGNLSAEEKTKIVNDIIKQYNICQFDILRIESFTVDASEQVREFVSTEPLSAVKLVIIDISNSTSRAQSTILALLEDTLERVHFLVFGNYSTLETVQSRSQVSSVESSNPVDKSCKNHVLSVLRATAMLNEAKLEDLLRNWTEECQKVLVEWAIELKLSRPRIFSIEELQEIDLPLSFAENVILSICMLDFARARISIKPILLSYVENSRGQR